MEPAFRVLMTAPGDEGSAFPTIQLATPNETAKHAPISQLEDWLRNKSRRHTAHEPKPTDQTKRNNRVCLAVLAHGAADDRKDEDSEGYLMFSLLEWNPVPFRKILTNKTIRIV